MRDEITHAITTLPQKEMRGNTFMIPDLNRVERDPDFSGPGDSDSSSGDVSGLIDQINTARRELENIKNVRQNIFNAYTNATQAYITAVYNLSKR